MAATSAPVRNSSAPYRSSNARFQGPARDGKPAGRLKSNPAKSGEPKPEPKILFQRFFKSVGPRTYAAQVKEAGTGNHFIVLTEGKRDKDSDQVRKTRLFVFGEDFEEFFKLIRETADFVQKNPIPPEVSARQKKFWAKKQSQERPSSQDARR